MRWSMEQILLDYKYTWSIARASSQQKIGHFISYEDQGFRGMGEVAGITKATKATDFASEFAALDCARIHSLQDIYDGPWSPPLRFGMESAFLHWQCQRDGQQIWELLGLPAPRPVATSISIPIMPPEEVAEFIDTHDLNRFSACKVKVDCESAVDIVNQVARFFAGPLRVDANESFTSAAAVLQFLDAVDVSRLEFLEQPMASQQTDEYKKLKSRAPIPIIADESIQDQLLVPEIGLQFHGINVKLMKAGSYRRAVEQLTQARQMGLKTMLGCMVETSLGIRSAMNISAGVDWLDLDGFLIIKNDPFALVKEQQGLLTFC